MFSAAASSLQSSLAANDLCVVSVCGVPLVNSTTTSSHIPVAIAQLGIAYCPLAQCSEVCVTSAPGLAQRTTAEG